MELKKIVILFFLAFSLMPGVWASDGCNQHLSPEAFREKQKEFITEKAGLTAEEADKFFPLYFELQDKKKELIDKTWKLMQKGKKDKLSDAEYGKIVDAVTEARIASEQLEKTYTEKFRAILSNHKIFLVRRAETRFHRELLKGIQQQPEQEQKKGGRK